MQQSESSVTSNWTSITHEYPRKIFTEYDVMAIALSPDAKYIASAGFAMDPTSIQIWDPNTGREVGRCKGCGHIYSLQYSKCGKYIISGGVDQIVDQWSTESFKQTSPPMIGHQAYINDVRYSPDERYIISSSRDKTIRIWNTKTSKEYVHKRIISKEACEHITLSSNKTQLALGDFDGKIAIWDYQIHKQIRKLKVHQSRIWAINYSKDSKYILSSSNNLSIKIIDVQTGQEILETTTQRKSKYHEITSATFSPDMNYIISGGNDNCVRIWDRFTGEQIGQRLKHHKSTVNTVQFSHDGMYIITGANKKIQIMLMPQN